MVVSDAVAQPVSARTRLEQVAAAQHVPLVGTASDTFLVLRGDPERSFTEPPPLVCRATIGERPFLAPLLRLVQPPAALHAVTGPDVRAGTRALSRLAGSQLRVLLDATGAVAATAVVVAAPSSPGGAGGDR